MSPASNPNRNGQIAQVPLGQLVDIRTTDGPPADAQFVKWLMEHQKEAAVFTTVAALEDQVSGGLGPPVCAPVILSAPLQ